jgi:hypothetical protein
MESFNDPLDATLIRLAELIDQYPQLENRLSEMLSERAKKKAQAPTKAGDVGDRFDIDRGSLSSERVTFGGLREPIEDDRQADLTAEYFQTKGGLSVPGRVPTVPEQLRALFFAEKPKAPYKNLTADQRAYRETHGGLLSPES